MLPVFLIAATIPVATEVNLTQVIFVEPALLKMEQVNRDNLDIFNSIVATHTKTRADLITTLGGRPPNPTQQRGIDLTETMIREFSKSALHCQQVLEAIEKRKKGLPWDECGFPPLKGIPPGAK